MFHWKTRCFHLLDSDSLESESFRLGRSVQRVLTTRWLSYLTSESFTPKAIMKNSFFKNVINILCHLSHERESKIPAFPEGTPLSSNEKSFPGAAKSLSWFQPIHQGWRKSCQLHLHPWRRTDGQSVNSGLHVTGMKTMTTAAGVLGLYFTAANLPLVCIYVYVFSLVIVLYIYMFSHTSN